MKTNKLNKVYETDASQVQGKITEVLIPKSIQELKQIVKTHASITLRGAGTGLAGGAVPSGTLVDLSKLNKISNYNELRDTIEVEAGVVLADLNDFLEQYWFEFPVNPSSYEVCTIGGMIATNAVGSRAVKYQRTLNWVEWIEIIDANGELHKKNKTELSDFVGMEGTTGIIVRACLRLTNKKKRTASLINKGEIQEIINSVKELRRNPHVSMIEFFDKNVSELLNLGRRYHILVEFESEQGEFKDWQYEKILALRHKIYPLLAEKGYSRIEDPKIFLDKLNDLMPWFEENKIPIFGHIGSGILHPCFSKSQEKLIPELMRQVKRLGGSISGEHGIGLIKKQFMDVNDKKLYLLVKKRNDPLNKFNPGKIADLI